MFLMNVSKFTHKQGYFIEFGAWTIEKGITAKS